jgi:clathrin heavy chain
MCPVGELVEQVDRRNRLRLLHAWLEVRIEQGNQEPETHNAIGKIYITLNREPINFLSNNQFYEPKVLGAFCEKLNPHLAFVAYKQAKGACDDELIKVTQENGLYKDLARYLVERQDMDLWTRVSKNFDGPTVAKMVASEEYGLYEEALNVYIKFGDELILGKLKESDFVLLN